MIRGFLLVAALLGAGLFAVVSAAAQNPILQANRPVTFQLSPGEARSFRLQMKRDGFAEITWLANDKVGLVVGVFNSSGKALEVTDSSEDDSLYFVAPGDAEYLLLVQFDESSEIKGQQSISLEYADSFRLPPRAKQKDIRSIAGFTVKVLASAGTEESIVTVEKAGRLKRVMKAFGGYADFAGFSFADPKLASTPSLRRSASLIRSTLDKTGDGIPDVMLDYFSGGAHCCFSTYFLNLGDTVDLVEIIHTEHTRLLALEKNPKGGLRFETFDSAFAYWNISFAGSPLPRVVLEFENGVLRPNFEVMKEPAPSLASLRSKARAARSKIDLEPYTEAPTAGFEEAFWSEMLDLIYSGNEPLAWQYFDSVWPAQKPGKERFLADFKEQLTFTYYGSKTINASNSFRTFIKALEMRLRELQ